MNCGEIAQLLTKLQIKTLNEFTRNKNGYRYGI